MSTCIHCDTDCGADVIQQAEGTCYAPAARRWKEKREHRSCSVCMTEMKFVFCWDSGAGGEWAYNLYACKCCGTVEKENVWGDKGTLVVMPNGDLEFTDKMKVLIRGVLSNG